MSQTSQGGMTPASISQKEMLRSHDHCSLYDCNSKCSTADVIAMVQGRTYDVIQLHKTSCKCVYINGLYVYKASASRFIMMWWQMKPEPTCMTFLIFSSLFNRCPILTFQVIRKGFPNQLFWAHWTKCFPDKTTSLLTVIFTWNTCVHKHTSVPKVQKQELSKQWPDVTKRWSTSEIGRQQKHWGF